MNREIKLMRHLLDLTMVGQIHRCGLIKTTVIALFNNASLITAEVCLLIHSNYISLIFNKLCSIDCKHMKQVKEKN